MSSSIDISDRTNARLEELRAEIRTKTGRQVSQKAVLNRIVEREYDSESAVIDSFRDGPDSISQGKRRHFRTKREKRSSAVRVFSGALGQPHPTDSSHAPLRRNSPD